MMVRSWAMFAAGITLGLVASAGAQIPIITDTVAFMRAGGKIDKEGPDAWTPIRVTKDGAVFCATARREDAP